MDSGDDHFCRRPSWPVQRSGLTWSPRLPARPANEPILYIRERYPSPVPAVLLQLKIRPHIGAAATALGAVEVGLDIRQRTRAGQSAAL
jgi:hypothetical protein